jgi:Ca2+-binding RTX toxin-like protein
MAFGASTSVQSSPRLTAFTAGPTAPYAVTKFLTSASDYYIGNWQSENIDGGGSNDILTGGGGMDYLDGNSGNDTVSGGDSHDALRGRAGSDYLLGGDGNDDLQDAGIAGADTLDGGAGSDEFLVDVGDKVVESLLDTGVDRITLRVTGAASYTMAEGVELLQTSAAFDIGGQLLVGNSLANGIAAGAGNDSVYGMEGDDGLFGEAGNDYLNGGQGRDWLQGGSGIDTVEGGIGDDIYILEDFGDVVVEYANAGVDEVRTSYAMHSLAANVENLSYWGNSTFFGQGNDLANKITGGAMGDQLVGLLGNDTLDGGAGNDGLHGSVGADSINGGAGNDLITGGSENDTVLAGSGNDSAYGDGGNDSLLGDFGMDTLSGDAGNDTLGGGGDSDRLWGGNGADSLSGGDGDDEIIGGAGRDMMTGGIGIDTFIWNSTAESTNAARDTVQFFESNDWIDLRAIDADTTQAGDQWFNFVEGGRPFFTSAGDLWLETIRGGVALCGDVNGDGFVDLAINFTGYGAPTAADILR